jgi:hypothetical protein
LAKAPKKLPIDYVAKIASFDWNDLADLWIKIDRDPRRAIIGWAKGKALEHLILRAFELSGAEVIWPYSVMLNGIVVEQIDGMVICDYLTCIVEVKDQATSVNVEPLAKIRNQLQRRPAGVLGSVFTSGGFTEPAITLAHYMAPQAILLWQGPEIGQLISQKDFVTALKWKHRVLMQHGKPDYDVRAGAPK